MHKHTLRKLSEMKLNKINSIDVEEAIYNYKMNFVNLKNKCKRDYKTHIIFHSSVVKFKNPNTLPATQKWEILAQHIILWTKGYTVYPYQNDCDRFTAMYIKMLTDNLFVRLLSGLRVNTI